MKKSWQRGVTISASVFLLFATLATSLADITLGKSSFGYAAAKSLKTTTPLKVSLGKAPSMRFVGRVGGVAFDGVAVPAEGFTAPEVIELRYDPEAEDGSRLKVKLGDQEVSASIYDWELIPVVDYADGDSTSCFTLFGSLEDEEKQAELQEQGVRILNYEDSFVDTLMGLRMFQLDVLVLDTDYSVDLPKDDGEYLLGAGEAAPVDAAWAALQQYAVDLEALKEKLEAKGEPVDFQSYVICDYEAPVTFGIEEGAFKVTGEPFYYFWNQDEESDLRRKMIIEALVEAKLMNEGETFEQFLERKDKEFAQEESPEVSRMVFQITVSNLIDKVDAEYEKLLEDGTVKGQYLKEYSEGHQELVKHLAKMNPAVWDAGRKVMRYSAFFRYCKEKHGAEWTAFTEALAKAKPALKPALKTPTVLHVGGE